MNKNFVKIIKIASIVASIVGMIGSSWADSMENKNTLKELTDLHFEKLNKGE